jgi:hypothetical protein
MTTYNNNKCIYYCCSSSSSYSLSEKKGGAGGAAVVVAAAAAPAPAIAPPPFAHPHSCSPPTCTRPPACSFVLVYARLAALIPTRCAHPHSSLLVSAYLCLFPLVYACSVICSFSLHVASVRTRLCPLGWVSVCADPRYPVTLVWPSFVLFWALVGHSVCSPASCLCLYQRHN